MGLFTVYALASYEVVDGRLFPRSRSSTPCLIKTHLPSSLCRAINVFQKMTMIWRTFIPARSRALYLTDSRTILQQVCSAQPLSVVSVPTCSSMSIHLYLNKRPAYSTIHPWNTMIFDLIRYRTLLSTSLFQTAHTATNSEVHAFRSYHCLRHLYPF